MEESVDLVNGLMVGATDRFKRDPSNADALAAMLPEGKEKEEYRDMMAGHEVAAHGRAQAEFQRLMDRRFGGAAGDDDDDGFEYGDGDQSPLKGEESQTVRVQWGKRFMSRLVSLSNTELRAFQVAAPTTTRSTTP